MSEVSNFVDSQDHFVDAVGVAQVFRRHKGTLILSGFIGLVLGACIAYAMTPKYQTEGQIVVRSATLTSTETNQSFESTALTEALVATEQEVLTSKGLLRRVAQRVDIPPELLPRPGKMQRLRTWLLSQPFAIGWTDEINWFIPPPNDSPEAALDQRVGFVTNAITIINTKGSSVIGVRAVTPQPELSAAIVRGVIDLYMDDRAGQETRTTSRIEEALRVRLDQTRQQIDGSEAQLTALFRQNGAVENSAIPGPYQRLTLLEVERGKALADLARKRSAYKSSADYANQQALLNDINREMADARRSRQDQSAVQIAVEGKRDAIASLWRLHEALQAKLIDLMAHPTNLSARVLTVATVPISPSFPKPSIFAAIGALVTLSGTAAVLLLRSQARGRRMMAVQFAQMVDAPLLASMPHFSNRTSRKLLASPTAGKHRTLSDDVYAAAVELEEAVKARRFRSIAVTSAAAGEGKTTVASLLGRALASMSLRILLVDLDLRHPGVEQMLKSASPNALEPSLLQVGDRSLQIRVDGKAGMHIYTPPASEIGDPLSYLRSAQLREIIASLQPAYDLLIFDTPPVLAVPDALMVARLADAVLLVSELGRNEQGDAAELSRRLASTHRPVCGVFVTKAEAGDTYYASYGR